MDNSLMIIDGKQRADTADNTKSSLGVTERAAILEEVKSLNRHKAEEGW